MTRQGKRSRTAPSGPRSRSSQDQAAFSYKSFFKKSYLTEANWIRGGHLLSSHVSVDDGVVTSLALDEDYIVVGMANKQIHIFDGRNGQWQRALHGHELGVWCLVLVSAGGSPAPAQSATPDMKQSYAVPDGHMQSPDLSRTQLPDAVGLGLSLPSHPTGLSLSASATHF